MKLSKYPGDDPFHAVAYIVEQKVGRDIAAAHVKISPCEDRSKAAVKVWELRKAVRQLVAHGLPDWK